MSVLREPSKGRLPESEIDTWNQVAGAWRRWWSVLELGLGPVSQELVRACGIPAGARVLDVGTGIGEPALTAAELVGAQGAVVGVDLSAAMLDIARERGARAPAPSWVQSNAQALPFVDRSFDRVLCRFGLMHVPDTSAALAEIRRVLRPGGRFAFAVWGARDEVPFLSACRDAVIRTLGLPPDDPEDGPFRLHDAMSLVTLLGDAGFRVVDRQELTVTLTFADDREYARFVLDVSGWTQRALAHQGAGARVRVSRAIQDEVRPYWTDGGAVVLPNRARVVLAAC